MMSIRAAAIFSDNMVLQHGKPLPVWGSGPDGAEVTVSWESEECRAAVTACVRGGEWSVKLPPLTAGSRGELIIRSGTYERRYLNVISGDVWFAGGQSNMELELVNCLNGEAELAACANPDIRFYNVVKRAVVNDDYLSEEAQSSWQPCAPESAATLSAVAYFFARKINADLKIPVGIINCSWGGTSISTWMSKEQLERSRAGRRFIDDYAAKVGGKTDEQYNAEMEAYHEYWQEWDACLRAEREKDPDIAWETLNQVCGLCPWPQPAGNTSPYCPANLHTARIRRAAPYALKGFIYYQGEEDELRAADYREMMYYLIGQWRADWHDDSLPFLFVQLPMFVSQDEMKSGRPPRHWCLMREAQYLASLDNARTGLAVIIDCGEYDNIHPLDKQTVGFRLALQALRKVYGKNIEADGPVFAWAEPEGGALRLHFDHAESGLESRGELCGFEIAAAEGPYYPARARIDGKNVVISSDKISDPCRARYAWTKFGPTPLYAKNGLPAMPFRTCRSESADL